MDNSLNVYTEEDVKQHNSSQSCWIIIEERVYDVTKFLEEHPGGEEVLLQQAGGNATEAFQDVGHSSDAQELMKSYQIGRVSGNFATKKTRFETETTSENENLPSGWSGAIIPLAIIFIALLIYKIFI